MPNQTASKAELTAMFETVSGLHKKAVRRDEKFLAYLFGITLEALRERIGGDVPMPSEAEKGTANRKQDQR